MHPSFWTPGQSIFLTGRNQTGVAVFLERLSLP
jgi:hypothetical protein